MPTVNLFYRNTNHAKQIATAMAPLKSYIAEQLTCGDISLTPEEVSIKALHSMGEGMIADVEMDMTAAPFQERIDKQDQICLDVQAFAKEQIPAANDVKVWLNLHEIGHSWR